ncbi:MAG: PEGA domain-containing protein [Proteobacteria bacterium]|nr:PEGA domain-containing protein [Pseudomonadota bacterium]
MYPVQLYGSQQQQPYPVSLTGALRLTEGDEIPAAYKIDSGGKRWLGLLFAGIVAISIAAGVTFLIIRGTRDGAPTVGTLKIDSTPPGADVSFDGTRLSDRTPLTLENVPVGTRHDIKVELALYKNYATEVSIPKDGTTTTVTALLEKLLGKVAVNSKPAGAEVRINGEVRGRTPGTFMGIDMATARTIEVRLKDYQPITQDLKWPANGQIDLDLTLQPTR